MISFRWYDIYLGVLGVYWFICLPVGLVLAGTVIWANSWHWVPRSVVGILAIVILIPVVWRGVYEIKQIGDRQQEQQEREAHSWVLEEPTTVAGIALPEDTKIYFRVVSFNMSQKEQAILRNIEDIILPGPSTVFGITFEGSLHRTSYGKWMGTLYGQQVINGWPCVGEVIFRVENEEKNKKLNRKIDLLKCALYKAHTVFGRTLPAGTHIELESRNWTFDLPDKIIKINPKNGKLTFSSDSTAEFNFGPK